MHICMCWDVFHSHSKPIFQPLNDRRFVPHGTRLATIEYESTILLLNYTLTPPPPHDTPSPRAQGTRLATIEYTRLATVEYTRLRIYKSTKPWLYLPFTTPLPPPEPRARGSPPSSTAATNLLLDSTLTPPPPHHTPSPRTQGTKLATIEYLPNIGYIADDASEVKLVRAKVSLTP